MNRSTRQTRSAASPLVRLLHRQSDGRCRITNVADVPTLMALSSAPR